MIEYKFDSFEEFLKESTKPLPPVGSKSRKVGPLGRGTRASTKSAGQRWDLNAGWDGAVKLARNGWPEGLERMQNILSKAELPQGPRSYEPMPVASLAGDEVDVGAYLSGEPECMTDWTMVETPTYGKVVKLLVHLTANAEVTADALFRRGAMAFLIVDQLESIGIRCEVWGLTKCSVAASQKFISQVCIKQADQQAEPDRMAFMLAHPAVFRRFGFRLMELDNRYKINDYGRSINPPDHYLTDDVIYLGGDYLGFNNDEEVIAGAKELAKKYLGEEEEVAL